MPDKDTPPAQRRIPDAAIAHVPQVGESSVDQRMDADEVPASPLPVETERLVCPVCSCVIVDQAVHNAALHPTPGSNAPERPLPPATPGGPA